MREAHAGCCQSPKGSYTSRVRGEESSQDRLLTELCVKGKPEVLDKNEARSLSRKEDMRKIMDT